MAVFSGKNLSVTWDGTPILDVQTAEVNIVSEVQAYASSDTSGWRKRVDGIHDATASITCLAHGSGEVPMHDGLVEGETGVLVIQEDSNDDGTKYTFTNAIVAGVTANVDADSGAIVSLTVNFENTGQVTRPDGTTGGTT